MVEGVEDVLSHNPDSSSVITSDGEQFETIYCDTTTFNGDEVCPCTRHINSNGAIKKIINHQFRYTFFQNWEQKADVQNL